MQGGDIDNGTPPRVLVHLDVVTIEKVEVIKILRIIPSTRVRNFYDRVALNRFWLFSNRAQVNLELFDIGCSQDDMGTVMDDLDRIGTNPFRWASAYDSIQQLVDEMPYRPELLGVIDLPERAFFYGSKYYDLGRV